MGATKVINLGADISSALAGYGAGGKAPSRTVAVTSGSNVIPFLVAMNTLQYEVIAISGVGYEVTAKTLNSFTINALDSGDITFLIAITN